MPSRFAIQMASRFGRERWNEHVKLVVNLCNAVSAASIIGALVAPLVNGGPTSPDISGVLILGGFATHFAAHFATRYIVHKE
jgi:hypothetical protein